MVCLQQFIGKLIFPWLRNQVLLYWSNVLQETIPSPSSNQDLKKTSLDHTRVYLRGGSPETLKMLLAYNSHHSWLMQTRADGSLSPATSWGSQGLSILALFPTADIFGWFLSRQMTPMDIPYLPPKCHMPAFPVCASCSMISPFCTNIFISKCSERVPVLANNFSSVIPVTLERASKWGKNEMFLPYEPA